MSDLQRDRVIALAGLYQSTQLVVSLAETGQCDHINYVTAVRSVFNTDPISIVEVYGDLTQLKQGLNELINGLTASQAPQVHVTRYSFSVIALTHKLMKNAEAMHKIADRLKRIDAFYLTTSEDAMNEKLNEISYSLAGIYSDVVSPITKKIQIKGKITHLQNTLVQAKIRTALLAAIRSTILWYQLDGGRLQLLFGRKKIVQIAQQWLVQIEQREADKAMKTENES